MSLSLKRAKRAADALKTWRFPLGWLSETECPGFAAAPREQAVAQLAFVDHSFASRHSSLFSSSFSSRPSSSCPSSPVNAAEARCRNTQNGACAPSEESNFEVQICHHSGSAHWHQPPTVISSHQACSQSLLNGLSDISFGKSGPWGRTTHLPLPAEDKWQKSVQFGQVSWALQGAALVHTTATLEHAMNAVTAAVKKKRYTYKERVCLEGARVLPSITPDQLHGAGLAADVALLEEAPNKRPRGRPPGSKSKPRQQSDDITPSPRKKVGRSKSQDSGQRPSPATPAFGPAEAAASPQSADVTHPPLRRGRPKDPDADARSVPADSPSAPSQSADVTPTVLGLSLGEFIEHMVRIQEASFGPILSHMYTGTDVRAPSQSADVTAPSPAPAKRGRPKRRASDKPPVPSTPAMHTGTFSQPADVSPALRQAAEPTSRSAAIDVRPSPPQDAQAPFQSADVTPAAPAPKRRGRPKRQALDQEPVSATPTLETAETPPLPYQSADITPGPLMPKRRGRPKHQAPGRRLFSTSAHLENADVTPAPLRTVASLAPRKRGRPKRVFTPPVSGGADLTPAPPQYADVTTPPARPRRQKRSAVEQRHVPAAKTCSVCGVTRPARDFAGRLSSPDRLEYRCRGCYAVQSYANQGKVFPGLAVPSKQCAVCKEHKEGTFFSALGSSKDGLGPRCRSCSAAISAARMVNLAASRAWNIPPATTTCGKCGAELPTSVFHRDDYALSGRASVCPACSYEKVQRRRRRIEMVPRPMVAAKRCCSCREVKAAGEFFCHSWSTDGLMYACKECMKASRRQKVAAAGGGA